MATMAKHKQRSKVTYRETKGDAQHWLMTRPYIPPVGLRHFINLVSDVKAEADSTKEEEQRGGCGKARLTEQQSRVNRMTVREAERIIRKIGFPTNPEDQKKYSTATYVVLKAIQKGYNLIPIMSWVKDLTAVGDEIVATPQDETTDEDIAKLATINSNLTLMMCMMAEAELCDIKELEEEESE